MYVCVNYINISSNKFYCKNFKFSFHSCNQTHNTTNNIVLIFVGRFINVRKKQARDSKLHGIVHNKFEYMF